MVSRDECLGGLRFEVEGFGDLTGRQARLGRWVGGEMQDDVTGMGKKAIWYDMEEIFVVGNPTWV